MITVNESEIKKNGSKKENYNILSSIIFILIRSLLCIQQQISKRFKPLFVNNKSKQQC